MLGSMVGHGVDELDSLIWSGRKLLGLAFQIVGALSLVGFDIVIIVGGENGSRWHSRDGEPW